MCVCVCVCVCVQTNVSISLDKETFLSLNPCLSQRKPGTASEIDPSAKSIQISVLFVCLFVCEFVSLSRINRKD